MRTLSPQFRYQLQNGNLMTRRVTTVKERPTSILSLLCFRVSTFFSTFNAYSWDLSACLWTLNTKIWNKLTNAKAFTGSKSAFTKQADYDVLFRSRLYDSAHFQSQIAEIINSKVIRVNERTYSSNESSVIVVMTTKGVCVDGNQRSERSVKQTSKQHRSENLHNKLENVCERLWQVGKSIIHPL